MHAGRIIITGPTPAPNPYLYPSGRKTASHVYQIFDADGRKLMSGSLGPDLGAGKAYALALAAGKGLDNPTVEVLPPTATVSIRV